MNVAVIQGVVFSAPQERKLGSGELATSFDVVTEGPEGRLQSAGAVQSRTEVLASTVLPVRRKAAVRKAIATVRDAIGEALVARGSV